MAPAAAPPFAIGGVQKGNPRTKAASRDLNRMGLLIAAQTGAAFVLDLLFMVAMMATGALGDSLGLLWMTAALVPLSTALPFALYLLVGRKDLSQYLKFEKTGAFGGALCVLGGLALCLLANLPAFFIQDVMGLFGYEPSEVLSAFTQESWYAVILEFLSTAVLVPVMEEFAFRGVLLSALRKHGWGFAIVASSLVFSLVHLDFSNVVFAFLSGLVFGFLYVRTNNLWLPILIHGLNNGLAVISSHGAFLFGEDMALVANSALLWVPIAIGVLALLILLIFKRGMFITYLSPRYDGPRYPLSPGESAASMVRTPMLWAIVGMMVLYTLSLFL